MTICHIYNVYQFTKIKQVSSQRLDQSALESDEKVMFYDYGFIGWSKNNNSPSLHFIAVFMSV